MTKYATEMDEWVKNKPHKKGVQRVKFMALIDDIAEMKKRYNLKLIWQFMSERELINISYVTFTKYCKKYLPEEAKPQVEAAKKAEEPKQAERKKAKAFVFDPIPPKDIAK